MAKANISVRRIMRVDRERALEGFEESMIDDVMDLSVKQAKKYSPVDTGRLRRSIERLSHQSIGSRVYYAVYQEKGTRYIAPVEFLKRGVLDAKRALRGMVNDNMRRNFK